MIHARPGTPGAVVDFKSRYENFIGGEWVAPADGRYLDNITPVTGEVFCQVPRSSAADIDRAVKAAQKAAPAWGKTAPAERAKVLLQIADRVEQNIDKLAVAETWDNGKPIRETSGADIPLVADHFRYFAGCLRAQEGTISEVDEHTVAYHYHEPYGVVGQIIPWNFPILMATWKLAPALAAGNCSVLKPAEQTPASINIFLELIADLVPAGVINVVHGLGEEAGEALTTHEGVAKIAFTGSTPVGSHIMANAAKRIVPATLELGGKSPNVYFEDVLSHGDAFAEKCIEGLLMTFFNQGEVCTCPSRALVHESIYDEFMARAIERAKTIRQGDPLDTETQIGAQVSKEQYDKILSYMDIGREEGAECLLGGGKTTLEGELAGGFYVQPTILKGRNDMRVFQEEIFGPTLAITTFRDEEEALAIANDTEFGLGAGVWTRDMNRAYRMGRGIQAGRVWTNCYHQYPAHAAFGGYKKSGIGRETHKLMLDHYQQVKCVLVSYSDDPMGLY
ncbi:MULTISPECIES: aldehyde dehydrogenase family protein [Chromohalobacter]|uniref:acetaldehyde dehydrogenase ExaC n=1 Tax=Chromohalobacter TaxID=42054 RepID=UPI001FFC3CB8|nr:MULTISPECIES: aldehyde dehydrogenase family protein [Chromohalobacter]MCK2045605.1 aldehyde dehydrogenase [Chromohalobacter moromii]MCT8468322.1 aldehyde dehydrogenase [Chromohalobacter canadensis]MCT8471377.1 aldehyde dehydrogenase [Chromohalobacter canadensis]MCT8498830.1 aldehyde dehydrogenase [Chromohalobacter canadensis]